MQRIESTAPEGSIGLQPLVDLNERLWTKTINTFIRNYEQPSAVVFQTTYWSSCACSILWQSSSKGARLALKTLGIFAVSKFKKGMRNLIGMAETRLSVQILEWHDSVVIQAKISHRSLKPNSLRYCCAVRRHVAAFSRSIRDFADAMDLRR